MGVRAGIGAFVGAGVGVAERVCVCMDIKIGPDVLWMDVIDYMWLKVVDVYRYKYKCECGCSCGCVCSLWLLARVCIWEAVQF